MIQRDNTKGLSVSACLLACLQSARVLRILLPPCCPCGHTCCTSACSCCGSCLSSCGCRATSCDTFAPPLSLLPSSLLLVLLPLPAAAASASRSAMSFSGSCSVPAASDTYRTAARAKYMQCRFENSKEGLKHSRLRTDTSKGSKPCAGCAVSQSSGEVMQACLMCRQSARVACTCYGRDSFHRDTASSGKHSI
jgi:hypothetical protein